MHGSEELKKCPHCGCGDRNRVEVVEFEAFGTAFEIEIVQCGNCFEYFPMGLISKRPV